MAETATASVTHQKIDLYVLMHKIERHTDAPVHWFSFCLADFSADYTITGAFWHRWNNSSNRNLSRQDWDTFRIVSPL
jgi:hypothetical protein